MIIYKKKIIYFQLFLYIILIKIFKLIYNLIIILISKTFNIKKILLNKLL